MAPYLTQRSRVSGFLDKDRLGVSITADHGFTIKDMLHQHGVELNLPPFLDGRKQLPTEEVSRGRSIASLHIHVEHAIGCMKNYKILCD